MRRQPRPGHGATAHMPLSGASRQAELSNCETIASQVQPAEVAPAGPSAEELARRSLEGDREALEQLVGHLQGDIFGLALRMLGHREDAEDATQEILIRIVTRLSQFDFRSRLKTWAWRIAANYVLDLRRSPEQKRRQSFRQLGETIAASAGREALPETERSLLIEEVKAACTLGMLQCLSPSLRAAFILGEVMELPGPEAAEILDVTPALFRKRLQQARAAMQGFLKSHCGLVSDAAPCRCSRMVWLLPRPTAPVLAAGASSFAELREQVRRVEEARRAMAVHRAGRLRPSPDFARRLMATLEVHLRPAGRSR